MVGKVCLSARFGDTIPLTMTMARSSWPAHTPTYLAARALHNATRLRHMQPRSAPICRRITPYQAVCVHHTDARYRTRRHAMRQCADRIHTPSTHGGAYPAGSVPDAHLMRSRHEAVCALRGSCLLLQRCSTRIGERMKPPRIGAVMDERITRNDAAGGHSHLPYQHSTLTPPTRLLSVRQRIKQSRCRHHIRVARSPRSVIPCVSA